MRLVFASLFLGWSALAARPEDLQLTPAAIDRLVGAEWKRRGLTPAPPADDAIFFRRIHLDLAGTIPDADAASAFLADRSPAKRARAVEDLLDGPRWADHFAGYWEAVLIGRTTRVSADRRELRLWLAGRFARNEAWDRVVRALVAATGVDTPGASEPGAPRPQAAPMDDVRIHGAVNWLLAYWDRPEDLGGVVAREFLGVQIQCAQCHRHPTERWTQQDFRRFAACFRGMRLRAVEIPRGSVTKRRELFDAPKPAKPPKPPADPPAALDGTDFSQRDNPRAALAEWITAPGNPWFARAFVNRMWGWLVGRGFFEPVDDLRPSNPPEAPLLLDRLAADFVAHGHDVKRLVRQICATRAYQLSVSAPHPRDPENRWWSRRRLRPLGPEQLLDAIAAATDWGAALEATQRADRVARMKGQLRQAMTTLFDVDEETAPPDYEGTVQQALNLMNGGFVNQAASAGPGGALGGLLAASETDDARIERLYLRALSRRPTRAEATRWKEFVNATPATPAKDALPRLAMKLKPGAPTAKQHAYEDLFWALLNSSEFVLRH